MKLAITAIIAVIIWRICVTIERAATAPTVIQLSFDTAAVGFTPKGGEK